MVDCEPIEVPPSKEQIRRHPNENSLPRCASARHRKARRRNLVPGHRQRMVARHYPTVRHKRHVVFSAEGNPVLCWSGGCLGARRPVRQYLDGTSDIVVPFRQRRKAIRTPTNTKLTHRTIFPPRSSPTRSHSATHRRASERICSPVCARNTSTCCPNCSQELTASCMSWGSPADSALNGCTNATLPEG